MRILACSDLHCDLEATRRILAQAGEADLLVVAGDIADKGQGAAPVLDLLRGQHCPVVMVPGNHDNLSELRRFFHDWPTGYLLHGEGITLRGLPVFGLGGEVPRMGDALWNFALSEGQAAAKLAACPQAALLITHSPPKGHCDRQLDGAQEGSGAILKTVQTKHPRLHLCGHIHASFGVTSCVGECDIHNLGPTARWFSL